MCFIFQDSYWVVHVTFVRMVKFRFLAQLPVNHHAHPVVSLSVLICCIRLLYDWSFRLYHHNLHLLFCWVLFILVLIWLVLMALFCTAIRGNSVSLLRFLFLSRVQVLSCEISLVCHLKCPSSCFSFNFCFLVIVVLLVFVLSVLFLVAVISLPLRFSV